MTTKAKRKKAEAWIATGGADIYWSHKWQAEECAVRWERATGRKFPVVHLIESDAAEVKALRRVARAAEKLAKLVPGVASMPVKRAVAALKKARR